ncbi:MAG: hypothetical protein U1F76_22985 [Candidatus Competibacteraceae bacterium]
MTRHGWSALLATAVLLLMPLLLTVGFTDVARWLTAWADRLRPASYWLLLWRLGLGLGIVAGWPGWIALLGQHYGWPPARVRTLQAHRWRVAAWLLVLELVLGQAVLVEGWRWLIMRS